MTRHNFKYKSLTAGFIILACSMITNLSAQEYYLESHLEAKLESMLILNVDPEVRIEFEITKVNDNLYQITKFPDDVPFSVESTANWNLAIAASEPYFRGVNDPSQTIPIDFISFYIDSRGQNWDNGPFSHIANRTRDTIIPLTSDQTVVLANGAKNNIGGSNRNSFVLRWKFNFEDEISKMRTFSNLDIQEDHFVGRFYITLSETDVTGTSICVPAQNGPATFPDETPEISATIPPQGGFSDKNQKNNIKPEKK